MKNLRIMPKLAKCGIHSLSFCNTKHDSLQCESCILVKHRDKLYTYKNGYKLKRCPHCGEYKTLSSFKTNTNGYRSWCTECHRIYARVRKQTNDKTFMIGYKTEHKKEFIQLDTLSKTIKFIKQHLSDNTNSYIEIKRIK